MSYICNKESWYKVSSHYFKASTNYQPNLYKTPNSMKNVLLLSTLDILTAIILYVFKVK